jgi:hypothetical protein
MIFENGLWTTAGEILGGVDYHSKSNQFTITGSLKISEEVRTNLQWKNAQVTREFDVLLTDAQGTPIPQGVIKIAGQEYVTDETGVATFSLVFTEANYNQPALMEAWKSGELIHQQEIDFFTETPIKGTQ